jgi:tetraacyldisaccharide 4'-kinase
VIPAGPLRAPLDRQLDRADALLIMGEVSGAAALVIAARARGLPLFHGVLQPDAAALAALAGRRVLAFAGIGDPDKFFATVAAAGIDAPIRRDFPDHHRYRADEAAALLAEAERHGLIPLTTEKDFARLHGDENGRALAAQARALPVVLKVTEMGEFNRLALGVLRQPLV